MAKRLVPLLNRVLVERIVPPSKTATGILLPEKSAKGSLGAASLKSTYAHNSQALPVKGLLLELNSGKVVAVGPGTRDKEGQFIPATVKEGDTVLLPEYGGTEVKLGDKEYHLYRDEDILGTLHD